MKAKQQVVTRFICCALAWIFCAAGFSSIARPVTVQQAQNGPHYAQPPQAVSQEPYVLSLIYDPLTNPKPVVRVRFNNTGPSYLFLVDTGTSVPLIEPTWT